jgi:membrane-associated protein
MSITSDIVDPILRLSGVPAYALVGGLVFGEAALFVGFVLPGETAVILGGVLAYRHSVSLPLMAVVVVLAAIIGDSVGYEVGRLYGSKLLGLSVFARHQRALEAGRDSLHRNAGRAVFLSRFTAFLRAVMPGLAGTFGVRYRKFLTFNAAGGLVWGLGFTLLGYLAGASYKRLESYAGRASEIILGVVVLAIVVLVIRHRRAEREAER